MIGLPSMRTSPAWLALLSQASSVVLTILLILVSPEKTLSIFGWAIVQGIVAAMIGVRVKMAAWWLGIHLMFMPTLAITLALHLPPFWFFIGFLLLVLIYGKTYQTQVPLYLSSQAVTKALVTLLPKEHHFTFIDLGSGCGGLLKNLSQVHENGNYHGIESAPLPYLVSKLRHILFAQQYTTTWGDFWKDNLGSYDVVYAYLSPVPMQSLWEKARQEMQPGSMFISNSFEIPGVVPEKSVQLNDFSGSTLYMWRI